MSRVWLYMLEIEILYQKYLWHMCKFSLMKLHILVLMVFNRPYGINYPIIVDYYTNVMVVFNDRQNSFLLLYLLYFYCSNLSCYSSLCHSNKDLMAVKTFHENSKSMSGDSKYIFFLFHYSNRKMEQSLFSLKAF